MTSKNNKICLASAVITSAFIISTTLTADQLNSIITKDDSTKVFSYKSDDGTPTFTDKKPASAKRYKTQSISVINKAEATGASQHLHSFPQSLNGNTQRVIVEHHIVNNKQSKKTIRHKKKRCQFYKKKFEYFTDRLRSGYKNHEYKKLEKNRIKYRNLLFNRCETKTFSK